MKSSPKIALLMPSLHLPMYWHEFIDVEKQDFVFFPISVFKCKRNFGDVAKSLIKAAFSMLLFLRKKSNYLKKSPLNSSIVEYTCSMNDKNSINGLQTFVAENDIECAIWLGEDNIPPEMMTIFKGGVMRLTLNVPPLYRKIEFAYQLFCNRRITCELYINHNLVDKQELMCSKTIFYTGFYQAMIWKFIGFLNNHFCQTDAKKWLLKNAFLQKDYDDTGKDWGILYCHSNSEEAPWDEKKWESIPHPQNEFWADPFVFRYNNENYIFFEKFPYKSSKGILCCIKEFSDNIWSEPVTVIEEPFHLSYPMLFEDHGSIFMIPESNESREIRLYRCQKFPEHWVLQKVLLKNIVAADSTVWMENNKYFLFSYVREVKSAPDSCRLKIFMSKSLDSEWQLVHTGSFCETNYSRPGGNLIRYGKTLYRISQDCSSVYGRQLIVWEIVSLIPYHEKPVKILRPEEFGNISRIHTLNSNGYISVIDGFVNG